MFNNLFSVPPKIRPDPPDGNYVVKKGRKVELKCRAEGNPEPSITWSRLVRKLRVYHKFNASSSLNNLYISNHYYYIRIQIKI